MYELEDITALPVEFIERSMTVTRTVCGERICFLRSEHCLTSDRSRIACTLLE